MRVKRFRHASLPGALECVRREMGGDALILQTKRVRAGGLAGFLGRRWLVEVTAAGEVRDVCGAQPAGPRGRDGGGPTGLSEAVSPASGDSLGRLATEVQGLREVLGCLWREVRGARTDEPLGISMYPPHLEPLYQGLIGEEVDTAIARHITDAVLEKGITDPQQVWDAARQVISRLVGRAAAIELGSKRRVAMLVGPTGVGKTTTIAKLAGRFSLLEGRRVAVITVDTFRMGAVNQIQGYADLAGFPWAVAGTPDELRKALDTFREAELVLIDTAGRSHRDEPRMSELEEFIGAAGPDEVHLVVSAGTRQADGAEIISRYAALRFNRLLLTKLDETSRPGAILNMVVAAQCPVSYITTGQRVPEDIMPASGEGLARMIV